MNTASSVLFGELQRFLGQDLRVHPFWARCSGAFAASALHQRFWSASTSSKSSKINPGHFVIATLLPSGVGFDLLIQILPGHGHVVGTLQGEDALEELQGQGQVGFHVLDGVEGRADAVRGGFVEVGGGFVLLLPGKKKKKKQK